MGTFGAAATQWAALRGKRLDAEISAAQLAEQRTESDRRQELEQKQTVYSEVNSAARNYRMQLHHCVMAVEVSTSNSWSPLSDAVWLLRQTLREDLGVTPPQPNLRAKAGRLAPARAELFVAGAGALHCRLKGDVAQGEERL